MFLFFVYGFYLHICRVNYDSKNHFEVNWIKLLQIPYRVWALSRKCRIKKMGHGSLLQLNHSLQMKFKIFNSRFDLCKVFLRYLCWVLRDLELCVVILTMKVFQIGLVICTAVSWKDNCKCFKTITEEQSLAILWKSRSKTRGLWFILLTSAKFPLSVFWHKNELYLWPYNVFFGSKF